MRERILVPALTLIVGIALGVVSMMLFADQTPAPIADHSTKRKASTPAPEKSKPVAKPDDAGKKTKRPSNPSHTEVPAKDTEPTPEVIESEIVANGFPQMQKSNTVIWGYVYDADDQPLAGVEIEAMAGYHSNNLYLPSAISEEELRSRKASYKIELAAWRKLTDRKTTTNSEGYYEIGDLYNTSYAMEASADGEVIADDDQTVMPGARRDFFVYATRSIKAKVLMPDGSLAKSASISATDPFESNRAFRLGQRSPHTDFGLGIHLGTYPDFRVRMYDESTPRSSTDLDSEKNDIWKPEKPTISFRKAIWRLSATLDEDGKHYYSKIINADFQHADDDTELVFQLIQREYAKTNHLYLDISCEDKSIPISEVAIILSRGEGEKAERFSVDMGWNFKAHFQGMKEGSYKLSAWLQGVELATGQVDIARGPNRASLTIPPLDRSKFMAVTIEGLPKRDQRTLQFRVFWKAENSSKTQYYNAYQIPRLEGGEFLVPRTIHLQDPKKPAGVPIVVVAKLGGNQQASRELGEVMPLSTKLVFKPLCTMRVRFTNFDPKLELHKFASVKLRSYEESSAEGSAYTDQLWMGMNRFGVDANGIYMASGIPQGKYLLVPHINASHFQNHGLRKFAQKIEIREGLNEIDMTFPTLYRVKFAVPYDAEQKYPYIIGAVYKDGDHISSISFHGTRSADAGWMAPGEYKLEIDDRWIPFSVYADTEITIQKE